MPRVPPPQTAPAWRVLLHLDDGRRVPLDPAEIFFLEAEGDETVVRTRGRRRLRDVRSLDAEHRATMILDAECRVVEDPHREERLLWEHLARS